MKFTTILVWTLLICIGKIHYALANTELPPQVVVLQYHHVSDSTPAITSIGPEMFKEHMQYINDNFEVVRLQDALSAIQNNESLPKNAIAISFDDGYLNILENAHPILAQFEFPYTVFINPDSISKLRGQLTWEQLQEMKPLADFANHTFDHLHLLQRNDDENESQWLSRVMLNIEQAEQAMAAKLGYSYKWLAYPFGEFNLTLKEALKEKGYIAFGQQSGAVSAYSDFMALPRFPASGRYANLKTLKVKMRSLSMPVLAHAPSGNERRVGDEMTEFSLSFAPNSDDVRKGQLACYFKGERYIPEIEGNTATITVNHTFTPGRIRINCTAPSNSASGRFYWHSVAFFTPTKEGTFLD